nr:MAG TPA: hypothetical protein [Caudoviricetes sp.]
MRKAPCITADQSRMQETHTNHHRGGQRYNYMASPPENQGGNDNE